MFVLGTAGHVDHGKSTLVKALTGIDPDRLQEEKVREMTIDLGFAWLKLPDGQEMSVVDVPGHERFIRNMLAGVGGIDVALLVVAADEGVMPQTREHLAVLDLLNLQRGVVAITKKDTVDQDWLELVINDVRGILKSTSLKDALIIPVSSITGEGLPALVQAISQQVQALPAKQDLGRPRLPIDRVFTMTGFGTVVTGTLVDGRLSVGQEVEIVPRGVTARIRGIQSHKKRLDSAVPGSRYAINLSGVEREQVERGDVLTAAGWLTATRVLNARVRPALDEPLPALHGMTVSFHSGTAEAQARVLLLEKGQDTAKGPLWVQLLLERPLPLVRGDLFILRSTTGTLGGGQVIEPLPERHKPYRRRGDPAVIQRLEVLSKGSPEEILLRALDTEGPCEIAALLVATGLSHGQLLESARALAARKDLLLLNSDEVEPSTVISTPVALKRLVATAQKSLSAHHQQYPLRRGLPKEELRSRLRLASNVFTPVLQRLLREQAIAEDGATVRLPGHQPRPSPEQERQVSAYLQALESNPYSPPSTISLHSELLTYLIEQGQVVRVSPDVVFAASAYKAMVQQIVERLKASGKLTVAEARDMFQTSRKYALALMEYLDQQHITRRVGDERVLRAG
jgi:selenocysteine-specific elongation factor